MPATPPAVVHDNLPLPLTRFVGRTEELQSLLAVLQSERLVTLTGVGGCGKTRLAREVAAAAREQFPDGVGWIELAPLADEALVAQAIAGACGAVEQPGRPLMDTLAESLKTRHVLLILDNCEHLAAVCAVYAQILLERCPSLIILATSRESLGVPGEAIVPVAPLPVPDEEQCQDMSQLARTDVISLFLDRARAAAPSFNLSAENVRDVAQICRKLDGIPLAIELAAARVRLLSPRQIAERLQHAFQVLGSGTRGAPHRQQTLQATLDWSYALLSPTESALFRALAVFVGDFTLEAVEGVCGEPDTQEGDTLDVLGRLVDKSLVLAQDRAGAVRYRLLEVIRQYAREKLEAAEELERVSSRHADYYGQVALRAGVDLDANERHQWFDILEAEHEHLRAAIAWTLDHGDAEQTGLVAASLWRFWRVRGHLAEGRRWLELALRKLPAATHARARVLQSLAILTMHHQGYAAAAPLTEEALALYQTLNDRRGLAIAFVGAGLAAHGHGDYAQAMSYFEQSLPIASESGWIHGVALSLSSMGFTALHLGEIPRALALCTEAAARAQADSDVTLAAGALTNVGIALLMSHQHEAAIARFEESLRIRREIDDAGGIAHTLRFLGRAMVEQGDSERAEVYYLESFALREALGEDEGLAEALEGLAAVAAARSDGMTAAKRLGAAETLRERVNMPVPAIDRPFYDRWLARISELLGDQTLAAAMASGRSLTPQAARGIGPTIPPPSVPPITIAAPSLVTGASAAIAGEERSVTRAEPRPRPQLSVFALGEPRVFRRDTLVEASAWTYSRARELLIFLLCREGASKDQIGLALWPDSDLDQLRTQLHPVLHHLRQALGGPEWILFERGRYQFNRALDYAFDVETFQRHLAQAARRERDDPARAIQHLEHALKLYRGDFLVGERESEWVERTRDELRASQRGALLSLGQLYSTAEDYARAAATYRRLIADDPYQEQAYRELMRCLARMGERAQALRTYDGLVDLLRTELEAVPAPESATLAERVRRGEVV